MCGCVCQLCFILDTTFGYFLYCVPQSVYILVVNYYHLALCIMQPKIAKIYMLLKCVSCVYIYSEFGIQNSFKRSSFVFFPFSFFDFTSDLFQHNTSHPFNNTTQHTYAHARLRNSNQKVEQFNQIFLEIRTVKWIFDFGADSFIRCSRYIQFAFIF